MFEAFDYCRLLLDQMNFDILQNTITFDAELLLIQFSLFLFWGMRTAKEKAQKAMSECFVLSLL